MKRFDTPQSVAQALARHLPRNIGSLLDPSVGSGALLLPVLERLKHYRTRVSCIDIDEDAINELSQSLVASKLGRKLKLTHGDFLDWSSSKRRKKFDCIIMNPPFAGKKSDLAKQEIGPDTPTERKVASIPMEAAFLYQTLSLLKDGGRLLAVLPTSLIMGSSLQWLRDFLLSQGAIRYVHELPPGSFPRVESRMYLLVFDKGFSQKKIQLLNHDLEEPHALKIKIEKDKKIRRLDYRYHDAVKKRNELAEQTRFEWRRLDDVAEIFRGDIKSPLGKKIVLHTRDFREGYWYPPKGVHRSRKAKSAKLSIRPGDILVKRVGRDCSSSFGKYTSPKSIRCSDCIFVIRPKEEEDTLTLLFSLKFISHLPWAKALLEKGTGANFINGRDLAGFLVPTQLAREHSRVFAHFKKEVASNADTSNLISKLL